MICHSEGSELSQQEMLRQAQHDIDEAINFLETHLKLTYPFLFYHFQKSEKPSVRHDLSKRLLHFQFPWL